MSVHPLQPLLLALYQKLSGDTTLMGQISAVVDVVPGDAVFPYLVMELAEHTAWEEGPTRSGHRASVRLTGYSRNGGRKQVMEIMGRLHVLLHKQSLTVAGFTLQRMTVEEGDAVQENDGLTSVGSLRVDCWLVGA
jgi:hypothetical protein